MKTWKCQAQRRNSLDAVIDSPFIMFIGLTDEQMAEQARVLISRGWVPIRTDPISVTFRSPPDQKGYYWYHHFWQEGY